MCGVAVVWVALRSGNNFRKILATIFEFSRSEAKNRALAPKSSEITTQSRKIGGKTANFTVLCSRCVAHARLQDNLTHVTIYADFFHSSNHPAESQQESQHLADPLFSFLLDSSLLSPTYLTLDKMFKIANISKSFHSSFTNQRSNRQSAEFLPLNDTKEHEFVVVVSFCLVMLYCCIF